MPQFVQIGDWAFNPAHIQEIRFVDKGVLIYWHLPTLGEGDYEHVHLSGTQAKSFHNWWTNKADVFAA